LYTDYLCDGLSEAQAAEFASEFIAARQRDSEDYYCIS
jgi:hypothetical protein